MLAGKKTTTASAQKGTDGAAFEQEVLKILELLRYKVQRNVHINGCQIDIYGEYATGVITLRLMVECKDYGEGHNVGIDEIMRFTGALAAARNAGIVDKGLLVTTHGFTAPAKTLAKRAGIDLTTYAELSTQLVNFDAYIDQVIAGFEDSPVSKYYIDLSGTETEEYESSKDITIFRPIDHYINDCLFKDHRKKLALLGNFGTGKSTLCRQYACTLAKKYREDMTARIPIIISLKDYDARFDIQTLILNTLLTTYGVDITPSICLALQRLGRFILIFDGFDEMDARATHSTIRENLRELNKILEIKENKFILTCRTHFFRNKVQTEILTDFDILYIPEWGEQELEEYLQKKFGGEWQKALRQISGTHNLPELVRTPLFMEMVTETLPKLGDVIRRIELYQVYTDKWIKDQSSRKGARLSWQQRKNFIQELALNLYREGRQSCHYKELQNALHQYFSKARSEDDQDFEIDDAAQMDYLRNDVQTCTFLVRDAQGNYSFKHKSFMEFFVATAIAEDIRRENNTYLQGAILPVEIRDFLIDRLKETPPTDLLLSWLKGDGEPVLRDNLLSLVSLLGIKPDTKAKDDHSALSSDTNLIISFMQGDPQAFSHIFSMYQYEIYRFIEKIIGDGDSAQDLMTEVFVQLWRTRDSMESVLHIRRYVYVLAQNKAISYMRTRRAEKRSISEYEYFIPEFTSVDQIDNSSVMHSALSDAMKNLSQEDQKLLDLYFVQNMSMTGIAKILGVSSSATRLRLNELIRKLKNILGSEL
ncbi:MAG: sigma-70 family RNA polymerase sigma factor [Chitinophagaceae bacterium]|nr:sigma-70 family RNA polymerase sigma factor [Chitinophagaceae bacterium]